MKQLPMFASGQVDDFLFHMGFSAVAIVERVELVMIYDLCFFYKYLMEEARNTPFQPSVKENAVWKVHVTLHILMQYCHGS